MYFDVFEELLEQADYSQGGLDGCRLTKVGSRMPYLDGDAYCFNDHNSKYWIVTDDDSDCYGIAHNTDGTYDGSESSACAYCGDRTAEDELYFSDYHEESYCDSCISRHFTMAIYSYRSSRYHSETYVRDSQTIEDCNGQHWTQNAANDAGIIYDENSETYHVELCDCEEMEETEACDGEYYRGDPKDNDLEQDSDDKWHVANCDCRQVACDGDTYFNEDLLVDTDGHAHAVGCTCEYVVADDTPTHDEAMVQAIPALTVYVEGF
jgi:hypothetical protein